MAPKVWLEGSYITRLSDQPGHISAWNCDIGLHCWQMCACFLCSGSALFVLHVCVCACGVYSYIYTITSKRNIINLFFGMITETIKPSKHLLLQQDETTMSRKKSRSDVLYLCVMVKKFLEHSASLTLVLSLSKWTWIMLPVRWCMMENVAVCWRTVVFMIMFGEEVIVLEKHYSHLMVFVEEDDVH